MNNSPIQFFRYLSSRAIVLYLIAFGLFHWLVDLDRMKIKLINRVVPASTEDLVLFSLNPASKDPAILDKYLLYFKTTVKVLDKSAAAHGLLAYCEYYRGNKNKAIGEFRKAIAINPEFFWFQYDLGVIYFLQGDFKNAQEVLGKAVNSRPEGTFIFINVSRIYKDLNNYAAEAGYNTEDSLRDGYHNAREMLMLCEYHLGGLIQRNYKVQIF